MPRNDELRQTHVNEWSPTKKCWIYVKKLADLMWLLELFCIFAK